MQHNAGEVVAIQGILTTEVEVVESSDKNEPVRINFGNGKNGFTLVGDLPHLHALLIEADRQLSYLRLDAERRARLAAN